MLCTILGAPGAGKGTQALFLKEKLLLWRRQFVLGIIIQLIVSGIDMGFIYALVGIEYTLIWNASGVLNFSHDKMITLGAYIFGGTYIVGMKLGIVPGIILSLVTVVVIGLVIARVVE